MSENKLVEKTRQVMKTQKELSELIIDLKSEVKIVYFENEKLTEENELLRKKLGLVNEVPIPIEESKVVEVPVESVAQEPIEVKEVLQKVVSKEYVEPKKIIKSKRNTALAEFFLGKNVIAKIATVLIFLGVISFGQIAYAWMPDIGRVLLILFTGLVFSGIAYYTEKKEMFTFSNVFYGLGVFIIYYSLVLAKFGFGLINGSVLSYLLVVLMAGVFFYFKNKRYEFLDSVLYLFYIVLSLTMLFYFETSGSFSQFFEIILLVGLLGYISYQYITVYYKENNVIQIVLMSIFSISMTIFLLAASANFILRDELVSEGLNTSLTGFYLFMYSGLAIFFVYLVNYISKMDESNGFRNLLPVYTVILIGVASYSLFLVSDITIGITNGSFSVLLFVIISAPLYAYLYLRDKKDEDNFSQIYLYVIALALLIYSFIAGGLGKETVSDYTYLNIILGLEVLLFYVLAKFTKDNNHRTLGIMFVIIFIARNVSFYNLEGAFVFANSGVIFVGMALGFILVGIYELFKRLDLEDNQTDNLVAHSANLLLLIPVVVTFTNDLFSDDQAYIFTTIILLLIGYRWLAGIKLFTLEYKNYFFTAINVGIILLTLFLNLFYFDHDFGMIEDVFKFAILFAINGYVVFSIKEIYFEHTKETAKKEEYFIVAYLVGVLVHSMFIHNYINVEFDRVILSSYFLIASAIAVLLGFKQNWSLSRKLGLGAIYYSLAKFFVYDIYSSDYSTFTRMVTYFILGFVLLGIALLYAYLEKTYGKSEELKDKIED